MKVLITGGAGFVGSNLALMLAEKRGWSVTSLDNLHRRGSELTLARLRASGVSFIHGDIRNPEDLEGVPAADLLIECSAEASVRAGYRNDARYLVNTNLIGTFNCLEWARRHGVAVIYLSTSRVYSITALRALPMHVHDRRLAPMPGKAGLGWSESGITESFCTSGARSLYGTTKLASELLIEEYNAAFGLRTIVNRCGVIAGPWQMAKVDQGFFVLWVARHLYGRRLTYTGFGGHGHQVRDVLHVADLFDLVSRQVDALDEYSGRIFNVGGGPSASVSLAELSDLCAAHTGTRLVHQSDPVTRAEDIPYYVTDNDAVSRATGWLPTRSVEMILDDVIDWLTRHRVELEPVLA
jgi:CDP-paratose 2-epimerase